MNKTLTKKVGEFRGFVLTYKDDCESYELSVRSTHSVERFGASIVPLTKERLDGLIEMLKNVRKDVEDHGHG